MKKKRKENEEKVVEKRKGEGRTEERARTGRLG